MRGKRRITCSGSDHPIYILRWQSSLQWAHYVDTNPATVNCWLCTHCTAALLISRARPFARGGRGVLARLCCSMLILMHQLHVYCVDTFKTCLAKVLHKSNYGYTSRPITIISSASCEPASKASGGGGGGRSLYPLIIREDSFYASTRGGCACVTQIGYELQLKLYLVLPG